MKDLLVSIHKYFDSRKKILFIILGIIFVGAIYSTQNLKLEEDISNILSNEGDVKEYKIAFKTFKLLDKLFVTIEWTDKLEKPDVDILTESMESFVESLNKQAGNHIERITYKISDEEMYQMYNLFLDHLPSFLNEKDYSELEKKLSKESIDAGMEESYKSLIAPSGTIYKKMFVKDPLHLIDLLPAKLSVLSLNDNLDYYNGYIITKDKKNILLFIDTIYNAQETKDSKLLIDSIDEISLQLEKSYDNKIKVYYYGAPAASVANATRIKKDVVLSVVVTTIIILILLLISFKNKLYALIIYFPVMIGPPIALAIVNLFYDTISAIVIGITSIIIGISVDFAILITEHFEYKKDMLKVIKDVSNGILISCVTTVFVFVGILFLKTQGLHVMAYLAILSIIIIAILSLVVLPHLIKAVPSKYVKKKSNIIKTIASYKYERSKVLYFIIIIVTLLSLLFFMKVKFDGDLDNLNYSSKQDKITEKIFNGILKIDLSRQFLISYGKDMQSALETNDKLNSVLNNLKKEDDIEYFSSISSILPSQFEQKRRIKLWQDYWSKDRVNDLKRKLVYSAKSYGIKAKAFNPFLKSLTKKYTTFEYEDIKIPILQDWVKKSDKDFMVLSLCNDLKGLQRQNLTERVKEIGNVLIISKQAFITNILQVIKRDYMHLLKLSILFVFIILFLYYGRLELSIISFLPISLSWLWALGFMGIFHMKFNIVNIIASVFVFGLGTDYSIYISEALLQKHKYGDDNLNSYKASVLLALCTTITGFGVMILAKHPVLKSLAFTSIVGLGSVVLFTYSIEIVMMRWLLGLKSDSKGTPKTMIGIVFSLISNTVFVVGSLFLSFFVVLILPIIPLSHKVKQSVLRKMISYLLYLVIYSSLHVKKIIEKARIDEPSIIIANHQSMIDIIILLMIYPKTIMLTKKWVWNSPIFGNIVRYLDFFVVDDGHESLEEKLKNKINEGYSIIIFPEGKRSVLDVINRFHKGSFYLAQKLKLDIVPVMIHGTRETILKGSFFINSGKIEIKSLPVIKYDDSFFGDDYVEKTKKIRYHFESEYNKFRDECFSPAYAKIILIKNYLYKGPVLEWYLKIKLKLENNYSMINKLIPKKSKIVDVGCGYGFLAYMLSLLSKERTIIGYDYDNNKISLANNGFLKNDKINFKNMDALDVDEKYVDVFLLIDMLHYMPYEKQIELIRKCADSLSDGGQIIIRDNEKSIKQKHNNAKLIEWFSVNLVFNKSLNKKLFFSDRDLIKNILPEALFSFEIIEAGAMTGSFMYVIKKKEV